MSMGVSSKVNNSPMRTAIKYFFRMSQKPAMIQGIRSTGIADNFMDTATADKNAAIRSECSFSFNPLVPEKK